MFIDSGRQIWGEEVVDDWVSCDVDGSSVVVGLLFDAPTS